MSKLTQGDRVEKLQTRSQAIYRVIVRYDDPRGGIWRGPLETRASADARLKQESARVHGSTWIEAILGVPP